MSKFDFNEVVLIKTSKNDLMSINGRKGVVRGKSQNEDDPSIFAYAVDILNAEDQVEDGWFVFESDLESMGVFYDESKFHASEKVRVSVDPQTGEGKLIDDD